MKNIYLTIFTGNKKQDGKNDFVCFGLNNMQDTFKIAEIAILEGYKIEIFHDMHLNIEK